MEYRCQFSEDDKATQLQVLLKRQYVTTILQGLKTQKSINLD
jgi:hypothetical protein